MTAYVTAPLRHLLDRARRVALQRVLALLLLGTLLALALHVLQLQQIAEALLNGGIALLLALRTVRL
ncbi:MULTISPECIES: hypothetical protein [Deinococcus]|uniref:Uncharacterized protein n=1 Tax=Deinococcus rufus TaxID=2136097 RepID=A0ABV7ZEZ3_9DEIO|nr:hypothetical protein [Deinococcus sp. AB2017081]WQE94076.1 hypothetical protein U2P90_11715 [Deinococcus sp. AB2017081]